ncbi:uncharacterized protein LOC144434467 [Glandiceps talaboti]
MMPSNCDLGGWGNPFGQPCTFVSPQNTCFQLYGTKRKATRNDQESDDAISKRQCQGVSSEASVFKEVNQQERHGPLQSLQDNPPTDVQDEEMEHSQTQSQPPVNHTESTQISREQEELQFIHEMTMESNDYWCAPMSNLNSVMKMQDELEEERIRMESDYTPDPYQYRSTSAENIPPLGYDQLMSGRVRCYCKPNWPEMLGPNSLI